MSDTTQPPVIIDSFDKVIEDTHQYFKTVWKPEESRPKLFDTHIHINHGNLIDNKEESYRHMISLDPREHFNVLPCQNHLSKTLCNLNCFSQKHMVDYKGVARRVCLYRTLEIRMFERIIEVANSKSNKLMVWKTPVGAKSNTDELINLRFIERNVDYLVVLAYKSNRYKYISSYPLFYINSQNDCSRDFRTHCHDDYYKK